MAIYGQMSINGSVEWLGIPAPFVILGWLGLITSWFLKRAGETELGFETGLGELNLDLVSAMLTSLGVAPSLPVLLTFLGVQKMRAKLCAASVTLAFVSTV